MAFIKAVESSDADYSSHIQTLIASWLAIDLNYFRYNLSQMADVLLALGSVHSSPERFNTIYQFIFCSWLHFSSYELFELMPQILNWI